MTETIEWPPIDWNGPEVASYEQLRDCLPGSTFHYRDIRRMKAADGTWVRSNDGLTSLTYQLQTTRQYLPGMTAELNQYRWDRLFMPDPEEPAEAGLTPGWQITSLPDGTDPSANSTEGENSMTTATPERTFTVGDELTMDDLDALPVGTVIEGDDLRYSPWTKGEGEWRDNDDDLIIPRASDFADEPVTISELPEPEPESEPEIELPAVGSEVTGAEDMTRVFDLLPTGSIVVPIIMGGREGNPYTKNAGGRWARAGAQDFTVRDLNTGMVWRVRQVGQVPPEETQAGTFTVGQALDNLVDDEAWHALLDRFPVGTVMHWDGDGGTNWTKFANNLWGTRDAGRNYPPSMRTNTERSPAMRWRITVLPGAVTEPEAPQAVTVPGTSLAVGMLFTMAPGGTPWLVYGEEDGALLLVNCHDMSNLQLDRLSERPAGATLVPQTAEHAVALQWAQAQQRVTELQRQVDQGNDRFDPRDVERFRDDLMSWAENESLDGDFDDLLERHSGLGFTRRAEDYEVTLRVQVQVTVSASDPDGAYEAAREALSLTEGSYSTVNGVSTYVTDIENYDYSN